MNHFLDLRHDEENFLVCCNSPPCERSYQFLSLGSWQLVNKLLDYYQIFSSALERRSQSQPALFAVHFDVEFSGFWTKDYTTTAPQGGTVRARTSATSPLLPPRDR